MINLLRISLNKNCINHKTNAATNAKLAPLTAVKCEKPTRRILVVNASLCSEVSPKIKPGISEPASPAGINFRNEDRIELVIDSK